MEWKGSVIEVTEIRASLYNEGYIMVASFPGFTRALVLRPIKEFSLLLHILIGLSTSARVKPGKEANIMAKNGSLLCLERDPSL